MSKEETKWDNQTKISVPILTDFEKTQIDNNFDSIVNQFIKQLVHEKELATAQHIIRKQKEYIQQLETKEQKVKEKLEELKKEYREALENNSTKAFILKCQIEILEEIVR